eukprot:COSAG04_NODE_878_length_9680_cov_2.690951_1_plen_64_part_10
MWRQVKGNPRKSKKSSSTKSVADKIHFIQNRHKQNNHPHLTAVAVVGMVTHRREATKNSPCGSS